MRATIWKKLFEEKGWLINGKLVVPNVKEKPLIIFRYTGLFKRNPSYRLDKIANIEEDFIITENEYGVMETYLWDDIYTIYEYPLK